MYLLVISILLINTIIYECSGRIRFNKRAYWIEFFVLFLLSGLRYRIGLDTTVYADQFVYYPDAVSNVFQYDYDREPGWELLNIICKSIWNDFTMVQLVQSFFVNFILFWFVRRHSPRPFFTILLCFPTIWLQLNYEALREGIAVAFYLYGLDAIFSKKGYLAYYLRVWPATLFHTFGFVVFLWPFITLIKPSKLNIYLVSPLICAMIIIGGSYIADYVVPLLMLQEGTAATKMMTYFQSDVYGTRNLNVNGLIALVCGTILPLFWTAMQASLAVNNDRLRKLTPYLVVLMMISCFVISLPIFFRFRNYFYVIQFIAWTYCLDYRFFAAKYRLWSKVLIFLFFFFVFYDFIGIDGGSGIRVLYRYAPYNSVITKHTNPNSEALFKYYQ